MTREVSTGPVGGNDAYDVFFERISGDGKQAFFSTSEPPGPGRHRQQTGRLRAGPRRRHDRVRLQGRPLLRACGNGAGDATFAGATGDGEAVFFVTSESLAGADQDSSFDIYARDLAAGTTKLVSAGRELLRGAAGNGAFTASFWGVARERDRAFFTTHEQLSTADLDSNDDIYARTWRRADGPRLGGQLSCPPAAATAPRCRLPRQLQRAALASSSRPTRHSPPAT